MTPSRRSRLSENRVVRVEALGACGPSPIGYDEDVRRVVQQAMLRLAIRRAVRPGDPAAPDGAPPVGDRRAGQPEDEAPAGRVGASGRAPGHTDGDPDVALLLESVVAGSPGAETALLEVVYGELRAIAGSFFKRQVMNHTLQPTALVHEAYMKLLGGGRAAQGTASFENRAHFVAVAAKAMRQVLIDHARRKRAEKRGGGPNGAADAERVTLSGLALDDADTPVDALDIHEHLNRLAAIDERQARVVELRFFAGLSVPEAAQVLGVSDRTVELDWRMARAWLRRSLSEAGA